MRRAVAFPVGIGLTLLAFVAAFAGPSDDVAEAPFPMTGAVGDEIVGLHHVVTVHEVALADEVTVELREATTAGVWFVAEATIASRVERLTVDADLFVDGVRYAATTRLDSDVIDGNISDAGFPTTGPILVELPADILDRPGARSAILRISPGGDARLDGVVELRIDLTGLERHDALELEPVRDGAE